MASPRRVALLASALLISALAGAPLLAQAPHISKPRPAPPTPPKIAPLTPAVIDNTLAIGGDELKAREVDTRLSVEVNVNGRGPYRFIVDSGADTSAVGLRIARDLQLPLGTPAILNGMTSRNLVDRVRVGQLTMGPSIVHDLELPALKEVDLGGDGLIGIDALTQQRLMMDFEKRLIKVEDASIPEKYVPGSIVIVGRLQRGQLILTHVRAAGFSLDAVIDTGTEVTIGNTALRDKLLRRNTGKFYTVSAIGVTGVPMELQLARIPKLQLGSVTLEDVPIAFADVPPFKVFGLSDQPALLLGTDILNTFRRLSLDFRSRKVRFQLRKCDADGIVIDTSHMTGGFTRLYSSGGDAVCTR